VGQGEPTYTVVTPITRQTTEFLHPNRYPQSLTGCTVAFLWDDIFKGDQMFAAIQEQIIARYGDVKFVGPTEFGNIHGPDEVNVVSQLPERLTAASVDVAVVAVGACGSCAPAVMRAAAMVEKAGIPTVSILGSGFELAGRTVARMMGVPWAHVAIYPGTPMSDTSEIFTKKVQESIVPAVIRALVTPPDRTDIEKYVKKNAEQSQSEREPLFSGTLHEVHEYFYERQWTDGLPIIPPTMHAIEEFLAYTSRDPREVLGVLLPARREATVWSVAVNGVLAGCRPEYMPTLLAITECVCDPEFRVQDGGSTPGWEPLVIVSGAVVKDLDFNSDTCAMRIGRRANSSIGRFVRLYFRNIAGLLPPPGHTDQGAIASNFHVALAENDDFVRRELSWPTYREEKGYSLEDSVVGVQSVLTVGMPIYTGGDTADDHLWGIARGFADSMGGWAGAGALYRKWSPLLIIGPSTAKALGTSSRLLQRRRRPAPGCSRGCRCDRARPSARRLS